jgi:hypothetical protein
LSAITGGVEFHAGANELWPEPPADSDAVGMKPTRAPLGVSLTLVNVPNVPMAG